MNYQPAATLGGGFTGGLMPPDLFYPVMPNYSDRGKGAIPVSRPVLIICGLSVPFSVAEFRSLLGIKNEANTQYCEEPRN